MLWSEIESIFSELALLSPQNLDLNSSKNRATVLRRNSHKLKSSPPIAVSYTVNRQFLSAKSSLPWECCKTTDLRVEDDNDDDESSSSDSGF